MRVLVTGSSGRIGSAVVQRIAKSHEVIGLDIVAGPHTNRLGNIGDTTL